MDSKHEQLAEKVAIITGAAGILGKQFSKALVEQNTHLVLLDLDRNLLDDCASALFAINPRVKILPLVCSVADPDSVNSMLRTALGVFPGIDLLVNNAATKTDSLKNFIEPFERYSLETWRQVMAVNIDGMFLMAQAVGNQMIEQGRGGNMVQIASIYGVLAPDHRIYEGSNYCDMPISCPAVYSVSKAGVIALSQYLAAYWGKHNIRVNSISPGGVESGQNQIFQEKYSYRVPLGEMGRPEDISETLLFLASSRYITGQNIIVDGGLSCW